MNSPTNTETWRLRVHRSISGYRIVQGRRPHQKTMHILEMPNYVLKSVRADTKGMTRGKLLPGATFNPQSTNTVKRWGRGWYWTVEIVNPFRGC
jgi:hypothetical protein